MTAVDRWLTVACKLHHRSRVRLQPEDSPQSGSLVIHMSVYRTLRHDVPSDVNVSDIGRLVRLRLWRGSVIACIAEFSKEAKRLNIDIS